MIRLTEKEWSDISEYLPEDKFSKMEMDLFEKNAQFPIIKTNLKYTYFNSITYNQEINSVQIKCEKLDKYWGISPVFYDWNRKFVLPNKRLLLHLPSGRSAYRFSSRNQLLSVWKYLKFQDIHYFDRKKIKKEILITGIENVLYFNTSIGKEIKMKLKKCKVPINSEASFLMICEKCGFKSWYYGQAIPDPNEQCPICPLKSKIIRNKRVIKRNS